MDRMDAYHQIANRYNQTPNLTTNFFANGACPSTSSVAGSIFGEVLGIGSAIAMAAIMKTGDNCLAGTSGDSGGSVTSTLNAQLQTLNLSIESVDDMISECSAKIMTKEDYEASSKDIEDRKTAFINQHNNVANNNNTALHEYNALTKQFPNIDADCTKYKSLTLEQTTLKNDSEAAQAELNQLGNEPSDPNAKVGYESMKKTITERKERIDQELERKNNELNAIKDRYKDFNGEPSEAKKKIDDLKKLAIDDSKTENNKTKTSMTVSEYNQKLKDFDDEKVALDKKYKESDVHKKSLEALQKQRATYVSQKTEIEVKLKTQSRLNDQIARKDNEIKGLKAYKKSLKKTDNNGNKRNWLQRLFGTGHSDQYKATKQQIKDVKTQKRILEGYE